MKGVLVFLLILAAAAMLFPILGTITAKAEANLNPILKGKIIAIDAGHGGYDPGAVGVSGTLEKDINLQLALKVESVLVANGAKVVMTRTDDTCFSETKKVDLDARADLALKQKADIFLSIQCNALTDKSCRGAQVFYYPKSTKGERLAVSVQNALRQMAPENTREALTGGTIYILRALSIPAVIVEAGFLSNREEEAQLQTEVYQQQIAEAVVAGIVRYYEESDAIEDVFADTLVAGR